MMMAMYVKPTPPPRWSIAKLSRSRMPLRERSTDEHVKMKAALEPWGIWGDALGPVLNVLVL